MTYSVINQSLTSFEEDLRTFSESIGEVLLAECDRRKVHGYFDHENDLDLALWHRAKELGWFAIGVSEKFAGLGLGLAASTRFFARSEAASRQDPFIPLWPGLNGCRSAHRPRRLRNS